MTTTIAVCYGIGVAILLVALIVDAIAQRRSLDNWLPAPFPVAPPPAQRLPYAVMDRPGRRRLEMMSDRIEACLAGAKINGQVWGGEITPDALRFSLSSYMPLRFIIRISDEIALSLNVPVVQIEGDENAMSGWVVIPTQWREEVHDGRHE